MISKYLKIQISLRMQDIVSTANHWDNVYSTKKASDLGWYQENPQPDIDLIKGIPLKTSDKVLVVGAGVSTIIPHLIEDDKELNLILTDISEVALSKLRNQFEPNKNRLDFVHDDLAKPIQLQNIALVDLWYDRAVLHFLNLKQRTSYKDLVLKLVKVKGYVLIAVFNQDGATRCSGLNVMRYSSHNLEEFLGPSFKLVKVIDHNYVNPNGDIRPYVYCVFQRM